VAVLSRKITVLALVLALCASFALGASGASAQDRKQSSKMLSVTPGNKIANGESINPVISGDRRWADVIAFESTASDLVRGDTNGERDIFMIHRAGKYGNDGTSWRGGDTVLISAPKGGKANGPSFAPAVDGAFTTRASCIAFLSDASNLVVGDTNGVTDAFVSRGPGKSLSRVSLPGGRQGNEATTEVAVSGDCSHIAFVTGGQLFVRVGSSTTQVRASGAASGPSFAKGKDTNDLVFAASGGVYLSKNGTGSPSLIAAGGKNPAYNDLKRRVVAYEKSFAGVTQLAYRDVGKGEKVISSFNNAFGDGESRDPIIGNSGFYVAFESDATNLGINAARSRGDVNGQTDIYLYSDVRRLTITQSTNDKKKILPGGGANPAMSYYANYILFDTPASLSRGVGDRQVFLRYLGPI
jgi:hypothetical protein